MKTIAFVAANESDPLSQRDSGVAAAKALGLDVVADERHLPDDTTRLHAGADADRQAQAGSARALRRRAGNAPLLIRAARELGYKGLISTETAQDAKVLEEGAGELANGFISVGGASTPEIRLGPDEEFIDRYTKKFGEYNDESNTKVYALEVHPRHAEGQPQGDRQCRRVQEDHGHVLGAEPLHEGRQAKLNYVGTTSFGQKRQLAVPMVVNEYEDGDFKTLFVGDVD